MKISLKYDDISVLIFLIFQSSQYVGGLVNVRS